MKNNLSLILLLAISLTSCAQIKDETENVTTIIKPGAYQTVEYTNLVKGQKIAVVANKSSEINNISLIDTLISLNQNIVKIFSPEHGFRVNEDAGENVEDDVDSKTGLKIISLHGDNKKPKSRQLENVDIMLFDLQDVGVRFYTYISTLHYVMEACAENNIPLIILDRPNPNAHYVDGPMLENKYKSFVGMHNVPIVYGMTIGEYGMMINGEGWLKDNIKCDLTVIRIKNYNHNKKYNLPYRPSPNLPNSKSINLYPSLCLFEGTKISIGRGTEMQFQIFGSPELTNMNFTFTPHPNFGSKKPKFNGSKCHGKDLRASDNLSEINIQWLINAYSNYPNKEVFFNNFFNKLAGTNKLKQQVIDGKSSKEISDSWKKGVDKFKQTRGKYLIYN